MSGENSERFGLRVIAILLAVGGIGGLAVVLWTESRTQLLSQLTFLAFAVLLFGGSVWTGIDLWNQRRRGYTSAKILFLLQIPCVSLHGFAYQFYVGLVFSLFFTRAAETKLAFDFELASLLNFQISPEIENLVFGVNLIAVIALIYLIKKSPPRIRQEARVDVAEDRVIKA